MRFLKISKSCLLCCIIWICAFFGLAAYLWQNTNSKSKLNAFDDGKLTDIIWWNSMPKQYASKRFCGMNMCRFSASRKLLPEARAVLFYGSDLIVEDLPLPRSSNTLWALLHEESPRNKPFIPHTEFLRHFNFTSTFSRYSDQPLTTQYLPDLSELINPTYVVAVGEKSVMRSKLNLAPIIFLQSDCDTMSRREEYVKELQRYIPIDSYGLCLHNRDLPKELTVNYLNNLYSPTLLHFLARYKFVIAYENGICDDYITEKFWRPLIIGSIPIYFGSPTIKDWEPNPKSAIYISDFSSPKALAELLLKLDRNDTEYNTYLNHKYEQLQPIVNNRLLQELYTRDYAIGYRGLAFFNSFECFVCRQINEMPPEQTQMATLSHYHCSMPPLYPEMGVAAAAPSDDWENIMEIGACTANLLDTLLRRNQNFTKEEFDNLLNERVSSNQCTFADHN